MMLPGTAMRDIMMHNVMSPFLNLFRSSRVERSTRSRRAAQTWTREKRRHWWRSLGALASSLENKSNDGSGGDGGDDGDGGGGDGGGVYTLPQEAEHLSLSRRKRTVGLYSYAPWLTNNVR